MPKAVAKTPKITYPPGCKELSEELNKDELLRRLKLLARAFQDMGQDENNVYSGLALYLTSRFFLDHSNKDVRLLVACCIADVFRIFAPEAPYTEPTQLKEIFMFLTKQLRGLEDPESVSFKRYFYLLENLAWVKSFNICIELDDNQEIFCSLYKLMFSIINEKHSNKVQNFLLDVMCPLITEADSVSQELLDIILINIIEPHKTQNKYAYSLAKDLIRRTSNAIEPYIQTFFNNVVMLGKTSESEISGNLFDLIYELNKISPSVLLAVLPQLEFKLKSSDEKERKAVTKLLAKMFSEPDSDLAGQNKQLWNCFIGRFNDIDINVRRTCVQSAQEFILHHPELIKDVAESLKQRQHDSDENVRMDVVQAVVGAAKKDFNNINDQLLTFVKERTLDKKFKIRKEALLGLGTIYKGCILRENKGEVERVSWIKNKILHAYYQSAMEDRVVVERLLNTALVPYTLEPADRMKRLYHLYATVDPNAVKALNEVFKSQMNLRGIVKAHLELLEKEESEENNQQIAGRILQLARQLPDPPRAQEYMKKLNKILKEDERIRGYLDKLVSPNCPCKKAEECVKEILKKMGNAIPQNHLYHSVKMLMERIAPVMVDALAIQALMKFIEDSITGIGEINDEIPNAAECGIKLLHMLSYIFPGAFQTEEMFTELITFLKHDDDTVADITIQIFSNTGQNLNESFPNVYMSLLPILQKMAKIGTLKQAKHAVRCIDMLCKNNKEKIFAQVFEHLKNSMEFDEANFLTSLVAMGHICQICPLEFGAQVRGIVSKFIVKELLMQDRTICRPSNESWYQDHLVSEETQAKIQAMKLMVRWLLGLKSNAFQSATSTLRLLHTVITHEGDLMERGQINKAEMARLRLQAGCCILKLVQEPCYNELVTQDQFQTVALLLNDPVYQVRLQFAQKLHKGLMTLRTPLPYMSIFCLAANDPVRERRMHAKQYLGANIQKRREYIKQHTAANAKLFSLLPDYVLPYAIHLLAHDPDLKNNMDVETLKNIKECLWFIMEPLIAKNEQYSYSFYRKLIENIKQTKDAQNPDNEEANTKMYAVCDLALGLVMTKTTNFVLKDFPAEPVLPTKLFTSVDQSYSNTKNYLPKELTIQAGKTSKKPGIPGFISTQQKSSAASSPASRAPASPEKSNGEAKAGTQKQPAESKVTSKASTSGSQPGKTASQNDKTTAATNAKVVTTNGSKAQTSGSKAGARAGTSGHTSGSGSSTASGKAAAVKTVVSSKTGSGSLKPATETHQINTSHGAITLRVSSDGKITADSPTLKLRVECVSPDSKSSTSSTTISTKSPVRKEVAKSKNSQSAASSSKPQKQVAVVKGTRKITDYVSKQNTPSKSKGGTARDTSSDRRGNSSKDSARGSPGKREMPSRASSSGSSSQGNVRSTRVQSSAERRPGRPPGKATKAAKRVRSASSSSEPSPKKGKVGRPRKLTRDPEESSTQSDASSLRSSPRKGRHPEKGTGSSTSPAKRLRGKGDVDSSQGSGGLPSPTSSSARSTSPSLPTSKKRTSKFLDEPKKSYPIRSNVRRAGPLVNGTSDGEDRSPASSSNISSQTSIATPPKKRAAALARAIEEATAKDKEDELNVKRSYRKRRR